MKFSYQLFRGFYYPIIPVTIIKDKRINTSAIVDSGASVSIFSSSIGRLIGLNIEAGEKKGFSRRFCQACRVYSQN